MESFEGSRYYRMVTSYWDMAASLVNNGAIDRTVFLDANTEHIAILAKIHPYLAEVQKLYRDTYRTFAKAGKVSRLELILPWSYESNTSNVLPISSQ